jgi:Ca2+-binding RTX toxin-like protein
VIEVAAGGADTVFASGAEGYVLPAGVEALVLVGQARLGWGNGLDNLLLGSTGGDTIYGREGADTIRGGLGNDSLWGGSGGDLFVVGAGDGDDVIRDFNWAEDRLDFGSAVATGAQVAAGYLFTYGAGDSLLLRGAGPPPPDVIL